MSWQGKVLRVDLSAMTVKSEPLKMDWAERYLGQRGLASKYLFEEMDPKVDPLSPENIMIFATGPLTGTMASTGGRWSVVTKGALTDAIACSNSGGYFGGELKLAGWDMVIFTGKAPHPVYLMINDGDARILDARDFIWGETVWETEERIKQRHQDPMIRIASIGKAGEQLVRFACVMNDKDRAAGRSGVGAVMGSKNLKAVAVRGSKGVAVHDPKGFLDIVRQMREKLDKHAARKRLNAVGTHAMMDNTNAWGSLPTRNSRDVQFEGNPKVNVKAAHTPRRSDHTPNVIASKACFACSIGCGRVAKIDPEHFTMKQQDHKDRYGKAMGGLEYESIFALAPMVGCDDLDAATYANALCNEHGMDPISFGGSVSAAMELYEEGVITTKETGGIELNFGNAEALCKLAELTGVGEGFGAEIGLGSKRLCEKYGRPEFSITIKGQEIPGYDTRAMQGMGLAYATSNRGACHMRASPYAADFAKVDTDGRAAIVKDTQDMAAAKDSTGLCAFAGNAWDIADYAAQVDAACGGDWDAGRMKETGERIWTLERQFNMRAGLTAKDDTLPERFLKEAAKTGAAKGKVTELGKMLPEYYELRGWTKDGVPTNETLDRVGI
ncbi:MAG: aldehyde ferredoxin oxidoreductase family protein [Rhodospirillaceae bacterium]